MTDYTGKENLVLSHTITTSDIEYVNRILHRIAVLERIKGWDAYRDGIDHPLQRPERVIVNTNRVIGWATIPLTGDEDEDVDAYQEGGDFNARRWGFSYAARSLGTRRRIGEPIPRVRLDRRGLVLVLLAHYLMHQFEPRMDKMTDPFQREWAVAQAQSLLAADLLGALYLLADPIFRGTPAQKLRQLDWLISGQEPGLVVCRHCFCPVDPSAPFLAVDVESEFEQNRREDNHLPRYSAHFPCYTHYAQGEHCEYHHYRVDYPSDSWIILEKYLRQWAIEEGRTPKI